MKKLIYLIVLIVILGFIVTGCLPVVPPAEQDESSSLTKATSITRYVPCDVDPSHTPCYPTIQAAINAAIAGDTIIVYSGTYNEEVKIAKALTLQGIGGPTIEAPVGNTVNAIWIGSSDVTVTGFLLRAGDDVVDINPFNLPLPGRIANVVIENNIIETRSGESTTPPGIFACRVDNLTVRDNIIQNTGGVGIFLGMSWLGEHYVYDSLIEDNLIENTNFTGILAYATNQITIRHNTIRDVGDPLTHLDDGIRAGAFGSGLTIECNDIYGCSNCGIRIVHDAASHTIHFNNIYNNSQYGLKNTDSGTVDATYNWWGHPGGPRRPAGNSGKISGPKDADQVSENVLYHPWMSGANSVSNIALNQTATASATYSDYTATKAVDGDYDTSWIADGYPPQWIEIDLGKGSSVVGLRLLPNQTRAGLTTHVAMFSNDGGVVGYYTLTGDTEMKQWVEAWFDAPFRGVRTVLVTTEDVTTPPLSWVAWFEIEVYGWQ